MRFLASHIGQTRAVLQATILHELRGKEEVDCLALGGGPGVEVCALADLLSGGVTKKLVVGSVDIQDGWFDLFTDLVGEINKHVTLDVRGRSYHGDASKPLGVNNRVDVCFIPWVLSEVSNSAAAGIVDNAVAACRKGGHVVILERAEAAFETLVWSLLGCRNDLALVRAEQIERHCGITFPEDVRAAFHPKLSYKTRYWVFRKT